jgi:hypothetical protein
MRKPTAHPAGSAKRVVANGRSSENRGKSSAGNRKTRQSMSIASQASTACKCRAKDEEFSQTGVYCEKIAVFKLAG